MTLSMSRCIGRADCPNSPGSGRGLCGTCYSRHSYQGTLKNFPTMRERTAQLRAQGYIRSSSAKVDATTRWRYRKYAERVSMGGKLIHLSAPHGKVHSYNAYGCRGAMCRSAHLYYKHTGALALPSDIRGAQPTAQDCVTFDVETFVGAYL